MASRDSPTWGCPPLWTFSTNTVGNDLQLDSTNLRILIHPKLIEHGVRGLHIYFSTLNYFYSEIKPKGFSTVLRCDLVRRSKD